VDKPAQEAQDDKTKVGVLVRTAAAVPVCGYDSNILVLMI
jgi:hypothetical protein